MGGCGEWIEMSQKNKPQSNTLSAGVMTLLTTGMLAGSTIFNVDLQHQPWTFDHSQTLILLVQIVFYLAAAVGALFAFQLVGRYEKKPLSKVYLVLVLVASLLLIVKPQNAIVVAFARTLFGLAHGMAHVLVLIHGGEVSIKELRGMLMSAVGYCLTMGIMTYGAISPLSATEGMWDPYRLVGAIGLVYAGFGGLLGQFLTYESPVFLIEKKRDGEALTAMMKLRNESVETWEIRNDFTELKTMVQEDEQTSKSIFKDGNMRPLILVGLCRVASVLSFNTAINLVRLNLLNQLFGFEDYSVSAVLILMIRTIMGTTLLFVVDKFGRRAFMTASTFASGIVLAIMGLIYLVADSISRDVAIAVILGYEVVASAGVTFVPDVYCSEAFSTRKKAASIAVVNSVEYVLHIVISVVVFSWNFSDVGYYGGVMMACGVPLLVLAGVFYRLLPETSKMSIRQTRTEFTKRGEIVFGGTKRPENFLNE